MNYAVVEKGTNRAIALIDESIKLWFENHWPIFNDIKIDFIEIDNIGSSSTRTDKGVINSIALFPVGKHFSSDAYHMVQTFPDTIDLQTAYKLLQNTSFERTVK